MGFLAPAAPAPSGGILDAAGILFGEAGGTEGRLICTHTHTKLETPVGIRGSFLAGL